EHALEGELIDVENPVQGKGNDTEVHFPAGNDQHLMAEPIVISFMANSELRANHARPGYLLLNFRTVLCPLMGEHSFYSSVDVSARRCPRNFTHQGDLAEASWAGKTDRQRFA